MNADTPAQLTTQAVIAARKEAYEKLQAATKDAQAVYDETIHDLKNQCPHEAREWQFHYEKCSACFKIFWPSFDFGSRSKNKPTSTEEH